MKYIITIFAIIAVFSVATVVIIWPEREPDEKDVVMTVNNHKVTATMIEQSQRHQASHHESRDDFLNSVAVEQVLIQEAQRQKIDNEPAFRDAIKNFYEQSLIKILLERKHQNIDDSVSDEQIDMFIANFGKKFTFSIIEGSGPPETSGLDWNQSRKSTELFDNLSTTLQPVLATMKPGESRAIFDTGNEWLGIRVDAVSGTTVEDIPVPREMVRKIIATYKRQQQLNSWVNKLMADANISIKKEHT